MTIDAPIEDEDHFLLARSSPVGIASMNYECHASGYPEVLSTETEDSDVSAFTGARTSEGVWRTCL